MPVPIPTADDVLLLPPDAEEVHLIAGAVSAAVAPNDGLTSLQQLLIEAIVESMTGFVVPAARVPRVGPEAFARGLARRDEAFRRRMLQFMFLSALVLVPLPDDVLARVESYGRELCVDDDMLRIAHRYSEGSLGLALIDFDRSGYLHDWDPASTGALHTSRVLDNAWQECVDDAELASRWEALRGLPEGTLGREVLKFYDARGFIFPG